MEMVEELLGVGARRFTVLGTCAEYAQSDHNLREDLSTAAPVSLYGREKHALHKELMDVSRKRGCELVWLRIFYPYGPTEDPRRLISSLISGLRSGNSLRLVNSHAERDYVHVSDVASAIVRCAGGAFEGTFNIGTGKGIVLSELERLVRCYAIGEDAAATSEVNLPSERVVADISKLRSLGWEPEFDIRSGIRTYFEGPTSNPQ
jgi:nucleoside-diphosphate-sugar epimerase